MKVFLTILCVAAALFGGGCGLLLLNEAGPLGWLPISILVLNVLILIGLWSTRKPWRPAFYILGTVDLLLAAGLTAVILMTPDLRDRGAMLVLLVPVIFAAKGFLTFKYAKGEPESGSS